MKRFQDSGSRLQGSEGKTEKENKKPETRNLKPETQEQGGPTGPEPTRYGDWEHKGKCVDF